MFLGAGVQGTSGDTNTIRLGLPYDGVNGQNQAFIAGIRGTTVTGGLPVVVDANGLLGTAENTASPYETALGYQALAANTTGNANTATP